MANYMDEARLEELWGLIKDADAAAIAAAIESSKTVETGSYVGTGSGTAKKITFNRKPQIVIIMTSSGANADTGLSPSAGWDTQGIIMCRGQARIMYSGNYGFPISFDDSSVTINYGQTSYAKYGMNTKSQKYAYIAVCAG